MPEGKDHKIMKNKIAQKYSSKGYDVEKEFRLNNGMIVDVYAEKNEKIILFEIGQLNGKNRIETLLDYCDRAVHLTQLGKKKSKTKTTSITLNDEYEDKLREIAEKQQRSMAAQVRVWIDEKISTGEQ